MSKKRKHLLYKYFKTLGVGPVGVQTHDLSFCFSLRSGIPPQEENGVSAGSFLKQQLVNESNSDMASTRKFLLLLLLVLAILSCKKKKKSNHPMKTRSTGIFNHLNITITAVIIY